MKTRKAAIIGTGHVGAHVGYALCAMGLVSDLVLIDKDDTKVTSEVQDLQDSQAYFNTPTRVVKGDFSDLSDCDLLINCAGKIELLRGTEDRSFELDYNIRAVDSYAEKIKASGFNGILINISNPCDVITRYLQIRTGLPENRVFGTGTALDTSRLISLISREMKLDPASVVAYMIGEHGNHQFAPYSVFSLHGAPADAILDSGQMKEFDWKELTRKAVYGGWVTFSGKFCTEYGIATTAARLAKAVFDDERLIIPVSAALNGEYGQRGLYAGVPCIIGKNGVEKVIELRLTKEELDEFASCCDSIRKNIIASEKIDQELRG